MNWISNKIKRILFIIFGTLFLVIGFVGVILPILPTTPFLLLAAACYLRSSKRIYNWMMNNRVFGKFIKNYIERRGINPRQKTFTLIFLWIVITLSIFYMTENILLRIFLLTIAIVVSIHIFKLKTLTAKS